MDAVFSYNPVTRTATLDPIDTLAAATTYTATLTSAVEDLAGNPCHPNLELHHEALVQAVRSKTNRRPLVSHEGTRRGGASHTAAINRQGTTCAGDPSRSAQATSPSRPKRMHLPRTGRPVQGALLPLRLNAGRSMNFDRRERLGPPESSQGPHVRGQGGRLPGPGTQVPVSGTRHVENRQV